MAFHPDADGNMAVFGTGGTGKSGALRAIGIAAGFGAARGGPTWVYGLDFASRGLQPLASLPHVGSVIPGDDGERVQRLLRWLEATMDDRSVGYARAEAATITEYRRRTGHADEPRLLVLVDGVGTFRTEYEGGLSNRWWELFLRIAAEGRALGIHVVMSADRPSSVPSNLASAVQRQLVLRLAGEMDYAMVDVPADAYGPDTPVGRGFLDGHEVQVAVIGGSGDLAEQGVAIQRCAAAMGRRGVSAAPPIRSLPGRVALSAERCQHHGGDDGPEHRRCASRHRLRPVRTAPVTLGVGHDLGRRGARGRRDRTARDQARPSARRCRRPVDRDRGRGGR